MQPHEQRVVEEKAELDKKIEALGKFIAGETYNTLPIAERRRLSTQEITMKEYSAILGRRIDAFPKILET